MLNETRPSLALRSLPPTGTYKCFWVRYIYLRNTIIFYFKEKERL